MIKDLGNAAVHADGSDVQVQDREFRTLLADVIITFTELLDAVYERAHRAKARLAALQAGHAAIASPEDPDGARALNNSVAGVSIRPAALPTRILAVRACR